MTLAELVQNLGSLSDELTIYAEADPHWRPGSKTVIRPESDQTARAVFVDGTQLEYLLEVSVAKEVIEVWSGWHNGQTPTVEEMCRALIYYSTHDAYLPLDLA